MAAVNHSSWRVEPAGHAENANLAGGEMHSGPEALAQQLMATGNDATVGRRRTVGRGSGLSALRVPAR